jgi:hypothetical protein
MQKNLAENVAIYNFSLARTKFPNKWKEANVTPIHKKDDKYLASNYIIGQ